MIGADGQTEVNIDINSRNKQQINTDYHYFDEERYKRRFVIERMNAWIDSFKVLLVRFETKINT